MQRLWPNEALEFGASVAGALKRAGGRDLTRRCEADPSIRTTVLAPLLSALGLDDFAPGSSPELLPAACLAVQAAGEVVCPWPLVEQLAVPEELRDHFGAIYLGDPRTGRLAHLDLIPRAAVLDIQENALRPVTATAALRRTPLDPFGVPCAVSDAIDADAASIASVHILLSAFWTLGALSAARSLAAEHAATREQFGRPIAEFGAVQWHLSDIGVAQEGLAELAAYSLGRLVLKRLSSADALALRVTMLEAANTTLAHGHQILAAIGLCDEHDLTLIDRHLQPVIRRPFGVTESASLFAERVASDGFDGIFPLPPRATPESTPEATATLLPARA